MKRVEIIYLKTGCELNNGAGNSIKSPNSEMRFYLPEEPNVGSDAKRQENSPGRKGITARGNSW